MASIEERVRVVEERMDSQSLLLTDMRQSLMQFEARVDRRFEQLDRKVDAQGQSLGATMTTHFRWTVGIMITVLLSVIGGMSAVVAAILAR